MKKYIILIVLIITSLSSCKKDKNINEPVSPQEQLPPATQEGKNTFGCLVNGQVWLPQASFPQSSLTSSYQSNVFVLLAKRSIGGTNPIYEEISYSGYFNAAGQYDLYGGTHVISFRKIINGNYQKYIVDSTHNGKITITKLDTITGIIAATFYFDAIDTTTNKVVHITEGRFDVKY